MIKINPDGRILGAAYKRWDFQLPTNMCNLFWKTFWLSAVAIGLGAVVVIYVFGAVWIWFELTHPASFFFIIMTAAAAVLGTLFCAERYSWGHKIGYHRRQLMAKTHDQQWRQNLREIYAGFKEKFCPLVGWTQPGE